MEWAGWQLILLLLQWSIDNVNLLCQIWKKFTKLKNQKISNSKIKCVWNIIFYTIFSFNLLLPPLQPTFGQSWSGSGSGPDWTTKIRENWIRTVRTRKFRIWIGSESVIFLKFPNPAPWKDMSRLVFQQRWTAL